MKKFEQPLPTNYGWPKWNLGFSMAVRGIILDAYAFSPNAKHPTSYLGYGLTRGLTWTGFLTIVLLPPTISPHGVSEVASGFLVVSVIALLYSRFKYPQRPST